MKNTEVFQMGCDKELWERRCDKLGLKKGTCMYSDQGSKNCVFYSKYIINKTFWFLLRFKYVIKTTKHGEICITPLSQPSINM